MKTIMTVFGYTFRVAIRKKAFIITTVIILSLILVLCSVPRILNAFTGGNPDAITEGYFYTCYIVDNSDKLDGVAEELFKTLPDTRFIVGTADKTDEYRAMITDDAKISVIVISGGENPEIKLYAKDFMSGISPKADKACEVISRVYIENALREQGVDDSTIKFSQSELPHVLVSQGTMNLSGYAVGILLITLTFFAVYYYGYGVAASIAGEKSSRVMETLIVSAKPSHILIGKCLGMGAVGLCQFGGIIFFAALCWTLLIPEGFSFMGETLSLEAFTQRSAILIIVFFILGYALYAVMNAVCGATVNKIEDLNAAMMPVMLISMVSFYLSYFTAIMGTTYDYMIKIAMYLPFSSPFIMPFILLNGEVSAVDIIISAAILFVTTVLVTLLSIRIYSTSVMHYGKRLKLKDAYKIK